MMPLMNRLNVRGAARVLAVLLSACVAGSSACTSPTSPTFRATFAVTDVRAGTGTLVANGMTALVNYTGWLYDDTKADKKGEQFDASPAGQPFVFKVGSAQVIEGWDRGVINMRVGGLRQLIIPAKLAYGREGAGAKIPPNATLVFDIELLSLVGG